MEKLKLVKVVNPFDRRERDVLFLDRSASSIAELVAANAPAGLPVTVSLNGELLPPERQTSLVPREGDVIVVVPTVHGGETGKQILRVIIVVVATIVGAMLGQYYLGPMLAGAMGGAGAGVVAGGYIGAAIGSIAGGFLANAILPPAAPRVAGMESAQISNSFSWNPVTAQQQGLVIPKHYGINKVHGNIISGYLEGGTNEKGETISYVNVLLGLGTGPYNALSDFAINDQPLYGSSDAPGLKGIEIHSRLGKLNPEIIPNFNDTKTEHALSVKVTTASSYVYLTPGDNFDQLEIEIGFPTGIFFANDQGGLSKVEIKFKVEARKQGAINWAPVTKQVRQTPVIVAVERWSVGYWTGGYWQDESDQIHGSEPVWYEIEAGSENRADHSDGERSWAHSDENTWAFWRWIGTTAEKVTDIVYDDFIAASNKTGALRYTFKTGQITDKGKYEVRVTRYTPEWNDTRHGENMYLAAVREVVFDDFIYPRMVLVGIRALATDQLSGSFSFSCMAEGALIRVYDGENWSVAYSTNPAWVCFDILTQPVIDDALNVVRYDGINPSRLDVPKFLEWAQFCNTAVPDGKGGTEPRITFNGGFDAEMTMWEAALQVCRAGRATLLWNGIDISVAIDKTSSPVQLFTVGNVEKDSFRVDYLSMSERASEIEADFINAENGFERDRLSVIDPALQNKSSKVTTNYFGLTKPSEIWRALTYQLNCNKYLTRTVQFQADVDAIVCTVGDVINVQHDVPRWGDAGGRLVSATETTVTLDKEVTIEAGKTYGLMVKLNRNDHLVERIVTTPAGTVSTLTVSAAFTELPEQYDVYAFGETLKVTKPFKVIMIEPTSDLKAVITGIEYNASIYASDNAEPVLPTPNYSSEPAFRSVTGLTAVERIEDRLDGSVQDLIYVSWVNPVSRRLSGAEVWINYGAGYEFAGAPPGSELTIPARATGPVTIKVRTVNIDNLKQPLQDAPVFSLTVIGDSIVVPNITGLELWGQGNNQQFTGREVVLRWNKPTPRLLGAATGPASPNQPDAWFRYYKVEVYDGNDVLRRPAEYRVTEKYVYSFEMNHQDGGGTPTRNLRFRVTAVAVWGKESAVPAYLEVSNPAPAKIASVTLTGGLNAFSVSFDPLNEPDVTTGGGYLIHLSTTPGFTPTANTLLNKGPETSKYVDRLPGSDNEGLPGGTYYIRVAAHDTFGTDALNYSDEYSVTVSDMGVLDTVPPDVPTALSAASGIEQLTQTQTAYVNLSWSAPTVADLAAGDFNPASQKGGYTVRYKPAADTFWTEQPANTNAAKITGLIPNSSYQFQVMAFDQWGNVTAWSSVLTATTAKKTAAPSGISDASLKVYGGLKSIWVEWTPVTDRDVAYYEILVGENGAPEIYRSAFENSSGYGDTDPNVSLYYPLSAWAAGPTLAKDPILQPSLWGVYKTFASITDPEYLGYPVYAMNTSYVNTRPFRTLSNKFVFDILGTTYITHHVKVRVVDTSGNASAWSSVKTSDPSKVVYSDIYVGNLAAISADLGTITAGTINATANVNSGSLTTGTMKADTAILVGGATNGVEISGAGKITVREGGADRIILGLQSTGYYGLTVRNAAGQDVFKQFKDAGGVDQTIIQNLTAATLAADWITSGGMNISWSGGNIRSGKATATDTAAGFWIGNNGGTPYLHVGNATKYMQWNGTALTVRGEFNADDITSGTLTGRTIQTAASGERFVVSVTDKQARFYDSGGNIKAIIGTGTSGGGSLAYGVFGDSTDTAATRHGVVGEAYDAFGVYGYATRFGVGVHGASVSGEGVFGQSANSYGVKGYGKAAGVYGATQQDTTAPGYGVLCHGSDFYSGGVWYQDKAPLRLIPSASATAPTHSADVGALWVTSAGVLYINKGSTTWEKVGAQ